MTLISCLLYAILSLIGCCTTALPAAASIALIFAYKAISYSFFITAGMPTLLATTTIAAIRNKQIIGFFLSVLLPLTSIALFVIHPIGYGAASYSLYWLIPVISFSIMRITNNYHMMLILLVSTFVAHATGSIIWLYTQSTTAQYWLSLIPVVAYERLVLWIGTYGAYRACTKAIQLYNAQKATLSTQKSLLD